MPHRLTLRLHPSRALAALLLLAVVASSRAGDDPAEAAFASLRRPPTTAWAAGATWDDGRAEVARYAATEVIYGRSRSHEAILITVKEDFDTSWQAKADWPYGDREVLPVMKTNLVEDVPTANYPYRSMTSVFAPRADVLRPHKLSYVLFEWCGNTHKELRHYAEPDGARLVYHTYWDGIGAGETRLGRAQLAALPQEQLFLAIRALDHSALAAAPPDRRAELLLLPPLRGSRRIELTPRRVSVHVEPAAPLDGDLAAFTPAGGARAWRVLLHGDGDDAAPLSFLVAEDEARTLLAADFGDGRTYRLRAVERRAYWQGS